MGRGVLRAAESGYRGHGGAQHVVLVVHGIGNRDRTQFERELAGLRGWLWPREVRPVFWGDLGPEGELASMPPGKGSMSIGAGALSIPNDQHVDDITSATVERIRDRAGADVPNETRALVHRVLREASDSGGALESEALPQALAEAVVLTGPAGTPALRTADEDDGILDTVRSGLRRIVDAVDQGLDGLPTDAVATHLRNHAEGVGRTVARTIGDVLRYTAEGAAIRGRLDAEFHRAREEAHRVDLLAHSLGGLIAVEWLLGASVDGDRPSVPAERSVHTLVTFGTQVALICELRGLIDARGLVRAPNKLPLRVRRWCNVWHTLDPLAFLVSPVLQVLTDEHSTEVEDFRLDLSGVPTDLGFHSSYWHDERFLAWVAREL